METCGRPVRRTLFRTAGGPQDEALMYGGHIALGISARRWAPIVPLWVLVVTSQVPDWMDVAVCTTHPETSSPAMLSHSFIAIALMAATGTLIGRFVYGSWYIGKILGLLVLSHLAGDLITGVKPTWPGGPVIGLRLYSRPLLDFLLESLLIFWSWWMYRSTFRPVARDTLAMRAMLLGLLALQAAADIAFVVVPRISKCG